MCGPIIGPALAELGADQFGDLSLHDLARERHRLTDHVRMVTARARARRPPRSSSILTGHRRPPFENSDDREPPRWPEPVPVPSALALHDATGVTGEPRRRPSDQNDPECAPGTSRRPRWGGRNRDRDALLSDVCFDGDGEARQVLVADDLAELALGFEHPGGGPAQAHVSVLPALDVVRGAAGGLDLRLARVRGGERALEPAANAEPCDRQRFLEAFAQPRGRPGMAARKL